MSITGYKRLTLILAGISALLLICLLMLWAKYVRQQNDMLDAWLATNDHERMRDRFLPQATVDEDVELLSEYSRPVPKYSNESDFLYLIIRSNNRQFVEDVITDLRKKTGQDLGDNPTNWIKKYNPSLIERR